MRQKPQSLPSHIIASIRQRRHRAAARERVSLDRAGGLLLASYNVHKCVGIDGRFDPERIASVIGEIDPDVIALQEADSRFGERRGLIDLKLLERETGLVPVPVSGSRLAHGWHGNVILFREGLVRDVHPVTLPGLEPRGALIGELELQQGGIFRIVAAHLGLLNHSRRQQTRRIVDELRRRDAAPTVLMGDLNEWRLGERSGLAPLSDAFGLPAPVASFPSRLPVLALDRIMANRPELLGPVAVHDTAAARIASDHLPIKAVLRPERQTSQNPDEPADQHIVASGDAA